jgi:chemotaxis signal transduction protein
MSDKNNSSAINDILKSRADLIAADYDDKKIDDRDMLLIFNIGIERYAIIYTDIVKALAASNITTVPSSPNIMAGIFYYEGEVWPILSSVELMECKSDCMMSNILLLSYDKFKFGIVVGEIEGQKNFDRKREWQSIKDSSNSGKKHIEAIYDQDIAVLSIKALHNIITTIEINQF